MQNIKIYLKPFEEDRLNEGHPWVYSNEINNIVGHIKSGQLADVYSSKNIFVGTGFLNTNSKIFVRLLTRNENQVINEQFFYDLILRAKLSRTELGYDNSYRAFFGESDGIPGLIVDKYGDYLSVQILSYAIDEHKEMFIRILADIFNPKGIYERSDVPVRKKEGLEQFKGTIYKEVPDKIEIMENELKMTVDIKNGQKTGFFLDQQDNHKAMKPYVANKTVLDCFSNIGGFGLHAAYYGASEVTCIDISKKATDDITHHAKLNDLPQVSTVTADVFGTLRTYVQDQKKFDVVVLDPPAFTKSKEKLDKAYQGYKEINLQALKLVNDYGYLVSASCSSFMTPDLFLTMLQDAAIDAGKIVQMVEFRIQSKDHPARLGSDETLYLKLVIMRVLPKI